MKTKKILDKQIGFDNFATFKQCQILANGRAVRFILACGAQYDVPLEYLVQWSPHPHYVHMNGELKDWESVKQDFHPNKTLCIVKCRRILSRTAVRIYLNDNAVYVIPWDTVLMACEPRYEHFGGWTKESKKIIETWYKRIKEQDPDTDLYTRRLRLHRIRRRKLINLP